MIIVLNIFYFLNINYFDIYCYIIIILLKEQTKLCNIINIYYIQNSK